MCGNVCNNKNKVKLTHGHVFMVIKIYFKQTDFRKIKKFS